MARVTEENFVLRNRLKRHEEQLSVSATPTQSISISIPSAIEMLTASTGSLVSALREGAAPLGLDDALDSLLSLAEGASNLVRAGFSLALQKPNAHRCGSEVTKCVNGPHSVARSLDLSRSRCNNRERDEIATLPSAYP